MSTAQAEPVLSCTGRGEALWFFGGLVTFKATAEQTRDKLVITEQLYPRGIATPLHTQSEDASFYVVDGRVTFQVGDEIKTGESGALVYIPSGVPHAFRIESETARMLGVNTPTHERFYRAAGIPAPERALPAPDDPRGQVDMARVGPAAERYGVEIVGPPPPEAPDLVGPAAVPRTA
jgi:quercetin dioxygenase-like cupin family protein